MQRRHELVPSEKMGRSMHLWCYGHWGAPLLVFPSAAGMAHEWEAHSMVEALGGLVEGGKLKLYCSESNVSEAWTRREGDPAWRIQRHLAFDAYVAAELVPFIRRDCASDSVRIGVTGCSLGAYYAANFALKYPTLFHYALCLSGRYDISHFSDGFHGTDLYFNNPLAYLPNLGGEALEVVRANTHLTVVCGQGQWEEGCIEETHQIADLLAAKGISHHRDVWGHDVSHDWVWWKRQALHHLGATYG